MDYPRPVSICDSSASDLAGEIVAALSAASLVFKEDTVYSGDLVKAAGELFQSATKDPNNQGTYTRVDTCGGESRNFYNSSGYKDELVWGELGYFLLLVTFHIYNMSQTSFRLQLIMKQVLINGFLIGTTSLLLIWYYFIKCN